MRESIQKTSFQAYCLSGNQDTKEVDWVIVVRAKMQPGKTGAIPKSKVKPLWASLCKLSPWWWLSIVQVLSWLYCQDYF